MKTTKFYETSGYRQKYGYDVPLNAIGVDASELQWCSENCSGKYGWYFNSDNHDLAVMTFESERDAFMYKIARVR